MRVSWRRRRKGAAAQAVVEFALVLPVLALITMSVIDFGRAYFAYEALANSAREGARYCALKLTTSSLSGRVTGEVNGTVSGVTVTPSTCPSVTQGNPVTVTVHASFTPVTPLIQTVVRAATGSSSIGIQAAATMMMTQ